ncbi:MAG: hypothetical protein ACK5LO_11080 [Leucobacter sp.]
MLSTLQRRHFGITDTGEVASLTSASPADTFSLAPRSATSGLRALRVQDASGEEYFFEYRSGNASEAGSAYTDPSAWSYGVNFGSGVTVTQRRSPMYDPRGLSTQILTHGSDSPRAAMLVGGDAFTTPGGITVKVCSTAGGVAGLSVNGADCPPQLEGTGSVTVSGTAQVGKTLSATANLTWSTGPEQVTVNYQWLRNGKDISGATGSSYKTVLADAGSKLTVRVTGSAPNFLPSAPVTAEPLTISKPKLVAKSSPRISGTVRPGKTLKASTGTWQAAPGAGKITYSYRWTRNGKAISKQTSSKYRVQPADVGAKIGVTVTAKASQHANGVKSASQRRVAKGISAVKVSAKTSKRTATVTVRLTLPGTTSSKTSGKVKVTVGGKTKNATVRGGKGTVKITGLAVKKHTVKVSYGGNKQYSKAKASKKIRIHG